MTTETTLVYSGRMTNWPLIGVGVAAFIRLVVLGRPWDEPWPGMIGLLVVSLALFGVCAVTSTSLRVTPGPRGVQVRWVSSGGPASTTRRTGSPPWISSLCRRGQLGRTGPC